MENKCVNPLTIQEIHKELDLIQSCIQRMAHNSFLLKGWLVSLIAVIVALMPEDMNNIIIGVILILITFSFWYLDAFFLRTERLYRKIYEWVLIERPKGNRANLYSLNTHKFANQIQSVARIMLTKTLLWFYSMPLLSILLIAVYLHMSGALFK